METQINAIRTALARAPPYCSGVSTLGDPAGDLFYLPSREGQSGFIDLVKAGDVELKALTDACAPATFGMQNQDVYDESYRKARKLDGTQFLSRFDPDACGIVDSVKKQQLRPSEQDGKIRAELDKLNVYDEGSFFKPHVDTPRGEDMFASLVVVFPTAHEGGTLFLRHEGKEWSFNSSELLSKTTQPSVAFVAFYSDIEHEVEVVSSGFRVTLTYNLYNIDGDPDYSMTKTINKRTPDEEEIYSLLSTLLEDRRVLPTGGFLGFGLRYKYAMSPDDGANDMDRMHRQLKGSDEILRRVCHRLSLPTSVQLSFKQSDRYEALIAYAPDFSGHGQIENSLFHVLDGCQLVIPVGGQKLCYLEKRYEQMGTEIVWVTPSAGQTSYVADYIAYGNEASISTFYGHVCLIAIVPPPYASDSEGEAGSKDNSPGEEEDTGNSDEDIDI